MSESASSVEEQPVPPASETVVVVEGLPIAVGLEWTDVASEAEAKKLVGKDRSYVFAKSAGSNSFAAGIASRESAKAGAMAAGLLIGVATPEALVFHTLPDNGGFWVCYITQGMPTAGADKVFATEAEAKSKYTDITSLMDNSAVKIGVRAGCTLTVEAAIQKSLGQLEVLDAPPKVRAKALLPYKLRINSFNWLKFALAFAVLMVIGGLVIAGLIYREQLADQRKREALLQQALQSQREQEIERQRKAQAVQAFMLDVRNERARFGKQGIASAQWHACEEIRRTLPLSRYAYQPAKLSCSFAKGIAEVEWAPIGPATRLVDRKALPGVVDPYSVAVPVLARTSIKQLYEGSPAVVQNPAAVRMAILDWGGVRMPSIRVEEGAQVVKAPPQAIVGEPGVAQVTLGIKAPITLSARGPVELLVAPSAMRMLDSYAVELSEIVWMQPASADAAMQASGALYLPNGNP